MIDAIEGDPSQIGETAAAVQFKIEDIVRGDFIQMKAGGLSKYQQVKHAAKKGKILKLLTLDFKDPDKLVDKPWMTVAVNNALKSFNILDWDNPGDQKFKLYFKKAADSRDSYLLVKSESLE